MTQGFWSGLPYALIPESLRTPTSPEESFRVILTQDCTA